MGCQEKTLPQKGCQAQDEDAQETGGVTVRGVIEKLCGYGAGEHGLVVDLVVLA